MGIMPTQETKKMKTRIILQITALAMLAFAIGCSGKSAVEAQPAPSAPVMVATVVAKTVPVQVQAIGNVEATSTVTIKAQISGQLMGVHFREGDFVRKG